MTGQIVYAGYAIPSGYVEQDFAVYVEGDRIAATGSRRDLSEQYPEAEQFGGDHLIMLPGFVNAHDHGRAIGTQSLGIQDSFLEVWLHSLGNAPTLPPYLAAAWEGLQLIKSGVTSTAHSHNPRSWETQFEEIPPTLRGYADAGVRVAMHPVIVDQNPLVYDDAEAFIAGLPEHLQEQARAASQPPPLTADEYFAELSKLYDEHHDAETHKVHIQASPAGGQWCSDELIMQAVDWAKARNTRVQMHMLETRYQRMYAFKKWGKSFINHLNDIGALGEWLTLAHMVWVEDEDIPLLVEKGVGVAHNPSSNLRLRSGIAPVVQMLDAGVRIGIGMDGHTLDDDQDFLREMRLAWTLANRPNASMNAVSASTILLSDTTSGAQITFGADMSLGYIKPGNFADITMLDWNAVHGPAIPNDWLPVIPVQGQMKPWQWQHHDTVAGFLFRRANKSHVRYVMMGGKWMLRDGKHTRLDEDALAAEIREVLREQKPSPYRDELGMFIQAFYSKWDNPPEMHR